MLAAMSRRALLLDAGNTIVFLDHGAVADVLGLDPGAVAAAEPVAKRRYEAALREGGSHANGWRIFAGELAREVGAEGDLEAAVDALWAEHQRFNLWRRVQDGFVDALDRARDLGFRIGVVSNSEGKLPELFEAVGLEGAFEVIVDSAIVGVRKPDPAIFAMALQELDCDAGPSWYAGDLPDVDVVGSRAAGLNAALIDPLDHYRGYEDAPRFDSVAALVTSLAP